ncbi:ABC transporter permease [Methylobrevis albus]|uniref:ABC transporter permease n=1 Tax=Methylobrevis albus TaxID=2793297 RepID=A0A931I4T6_9HYPH|nr:ABC transporter permease [Methylobrevis albus]MBH0239479.1 ABC transporter permease [Methylobrevis albus]
MGRFVLRRSLFSLFSLFGLLVLVFFLSRLTGDPAALYLPVDAPESVRQAFREARGLDAPLLAQFGDFLVNLVQFDFGDSLRRQRPAFDVVIEAFPWTLALAGITMALVLVAAIVLGALAAMKVGGIFDRISSVISLTAASAPDFWIALMAIFIFAVALGWVPTSGTGTPWHWILPIGVLFVRPFGLILQVVRSSMITALSSAYVKTARAKGVRQRAITFVHALRNAMLPVITVAGDQAAGLLNGAVVVETVFGFPGIGKLMIDSILQRDFAVVLAAIMLTSLAIFLMNLLIDLTYAFLDPRIRY